jgi:hypothetical protein
VRGVGAHGVPLVLVGCEYSATERDAFRARGIDARSCDLLPTEGDPLWHIQGDIRDAIMSRDWDAIILHLDCTKMAVCGNTTYAAGKTRHVERLAAIDEAEETIRLALSVSPCVAVENPASVIFPVLRRKLGADVQYIQPWQHGHPEQKKTGLALWGLPRITETNNVYDHMMTLPRAVRERVFYMSPGADRGHERARAFPGIADAMADQWGAFLNSQSTSALPTVVPAGAADCGALPHTPSAVGTHSGPDSSDHALAGHSNSYEFVPNHEDAR